MPKPVRNPLPMNQTNKGTYDNEIDLWNLEDDHSSTAPTVTPVEENSTPEKTEDVANTKTQDKFVANDEESKPFAETDEATDSRVSEDHQPAVERSISVQSIDVALPNPSQSKYALPSRLAVAPAEDEIWGDFTDEIASKAESVEKSTEEEIVSVVTKIETETFKPVVATIITPEPAREKTVELKEAESFIASEPEDKPGPATAVTATPSIQISKFSRIEIIASVAFLLILISGSFFVLRSYRANLTIEKNLYIKPYYPVKGQLAEVDRVVTYWRAPIKDGPNRDPIKLDVKLLPVIEITLGNEATQGALRVMFHNDKGDIVGDTVTQNFSQGKFTLSASEALALSSTAGFVDFGEQEAYRTGQGKPWTIKVYEGPSVNASSDQFRLLFTTPIGTERR